MLATSRPLIVGITVFYVNLAKTEDIQDVRVGRHRDKLELIRDSLRPFEQTGSDASAATPEQNITHAESHSPVVDPSVNSGILEQQRAMVDNLIAQGYEQVRVYNFTIFL
ncbi:unnamed protein product [Cylicostephanus goldi]|uniref:Uncharacterized protein n=1 Tax=Cylicostephanus goldi TaxID=71465 RepID=A0A3P7NKX4_CYLGO|nr:unnamed protein product [Cylicostephanus goldi]